MAKPDCFFIQGTIIPELPSLSLGDEGEGVRERLLSLVGVVRVLKVVCVFDFHSAVMVCLRNTMHSQGSCALIFVTCSLFV